MMGPAKIWCTVFIARLVYFDTCFNSALKENLQKKNGPDLGTSTRDGGRVREKHTAFRNNKVTVIFSIINIMKPSPWT